MYLSLDTPPRAVFFIQIDAQKNINIYIMVFKKTVVVLSKLNPFKFKQYCLSCYVALSNVSNYIEIVSTFLYSLTNQTHLRYVCV